MQNFKFQWNINKLFDFTIIYIHNQYIHSLIR